MYSRSIVGIALSIVASAILFGCRQNLTSQNRSDLTNAVQFIESFRTTNSRLPSVAEFESWQRTNYSTVSHYWCNEQSYEIHIWRGERMIVYSSTDRALRDE